MVLSRTSVEGIQIIISSTFLGIKIYLLMNLLPQVLKAKEKTFCTILIVILFDI